MSTMQRFAGCFVLLPLGALIGCIHRPPLTPYAGNRVLNASRTGEDVHSTHPIMTMEVSVHHHTLYGTLVRPSHITEEADGSFHHLQLPLKTSIIDGEQFNRPLLDIRLKDADHVEYLPIMLIDKDHLVMGGFPGLVPPWRFERVTRLPTMDVFKDQSTLPADETQP